MNSFPKPQPGSYRQPFSDVLHAAGNEHAAQAFLTGDVKLGIVASFTGNVKRQHELQEAVVKLLDKEDPIQGYYLQEMQQGRIAVVSAAGAFVYREDDAAAVAYVKQKVEQDADRDQGAIFFRS